MADDGKHWVGGMVLCSHCISSFALPCPPEILKTTVKVLFKRKMQKTTSEEQLTGSGNDTIRGAGECSVCRHPGSVRWSVCRQDYRRTTEQISTKLRGRMSLILQVYICRWLVSTIRSSGFKVCLICYLISLDGLGGDCWTRGLEACALPRAILSFPRDKDSEKSRKSTLQAITSEDVFL